MKERDTPLKLVRIWDKTIKDIWERLDYLAAAKDDSEDELSWPDYCVLPINATAAYLTSIGADQQQMASCCAELAALYAWRQNKVIYSFDRDLATTLIDQARDAEDSDVLPADLLFHLPYPVIYVKVRGVWKSFDGAPYDGFFFWIDFDTNRNEPEARISFVTETYDSSFPQVLHLIPGATLGECIADTMREVAKNIKRPYEVPRASELAENILGPIELVLYLCAQNAEIAQEPGASVRLIEPKQRVIRDKASEVKGYNVGVRIGAAIRRAKKAEITGTATHGSGSQKRPHSRRGHWHHFWTGPRTGERELILKWVAPTFIHPEDGAGDVVILPVKE